MGAKSTLAPSTETTPSATSDHSVSCARFGMPHAFVIIAFVVAAACLAPDAHNVQDVLLLSAVAGGIGAAVVVLTVMPGRGGGRLARLVRAYFSAGN